MRNAELDEAQAGIKTYKRNINNLDMQTTPTLMAESKEEINGLLMKVKEQSEKAGLKLNIQKMKSMPSGSITSWQIDEETKETVTDFIFLGSEITADGDYSHEIERHLLLGRKAMTNLNSILKSKANTLPTSPSSQSYGFSSSHVWMWGLDHKESECQRTDAFELWCWRRLLRVSWTARRSNKSILNDINTEYSLEGLMLKLQPQHFGHVMWRADSLEKIVMLGRIEGRRRRRWQRMRWLDGITINGHEFEQDPGVGEGQESLACCSPWGCKELDMT